jgi:hypothetical protein
MFTRLARALPFLALTVLVPQGCAAASREYIGFEAPFALFYAVSLVAWPVAGIGILALGMTYLPKKSWLTIFARVAQHANLAGTVGGATALAAVWATGNDEFYGKAVGSALFTVLPMAVVWRLLARRTRVLLSTATDRAAGARSQSSTWREP